MASVPTSLNDHSHDAEQDSHGHPTERDYIKIAAILSGITLLEVVIYYVEAIGGILVPLLIVLSTIKFVMVVSYFMHLKFDDKRLTMVFLIGMVFALGTFIGLWVLMHIHQVTEYFSNMM